MAGNNIYVQGSYVDIHDNEVVNLSVDKGEVRLGQDATLLPAAAGAFSGFAVFFVAMVFLQFRIQNSEFRIKSSVP